MSKTYFDMDPNSYKRILKRPSSGELDLWAGAIRGRILEHCQSFMTVFDHQRWPEDKSVQLIEAKDGEVITGETAHGVSFEKLKKVNNE